MVAATADAAEERAAAAPAPRDGRGDAPDRRKLIEMARKDPGVAKLLHEFGAQIVEIKPLELAVPGNDSIQDAPEESE